MSFHEIRFPPRLSLGSVGGPERLTEIVTLASGHEERNTPWAHSRRRYDAGVGMRSLDDLAELVAFFEARRGRLFGFRWKDWGDYRSCRPSGVVAFDDQTIGVGDGATTEFALSKTYQSGAQGYPRPVAKPVAGTVRIGVAGTEIAKAAGWTCDHATGIVSLAAPPADGVLVTAGFEFDVPVRFDADSIMVSIASFEAGEIPNVPVVEVRT
jgi:uncharacterized protein (TIGR02217 family)